MSHNPQTKNEAPYVICIKDNIYCLNLLFDICGEIKGLVGKGRGNTNSYSFIHYSRDPPEWIKN
jgi:hypothetical protein